MQSEAETLEDVSALAAAQLRCEQAAVMLGGADAARDETEAKQDFVGEALHEETLSILRSNLGADELAAAFERGRAMTLEQAVVYAIQFIDSTEGVIQTAP